MMNRRDAVLALLALPALAQAAQPSAAASRPKMLVHKTEGCGCCKLWVEHLEKAGFEVETRNVDNLGPIKERVGIPPALGSCHTGEVGGYFVEGHVPASDVHRLLRERPVAKGLTVPGMPIGSPGMEVPSGDVQPYDVLLVGKDGETRVFASHGK